MNLANRDQSRQQYERRRRAARDELLPTLEEGSGPTGRWAMLTIEVRRDLRRVVQARGRFNRAATREELGVLQAWATRNALDVSLFT
jgi:hypothetical protein